MYSWLVTVLLLASAANRSGGVQVPITSYTCTQPNIAVFLDHGQCTDSNGLRMCAIKEGARPALLSSSVNLGLYAWKVKTNPFVVLDIPQGWCVESVRMMFVAPSSIPTLSLSVHSAERLSTNTDRTMFSLVSENGTTPVVMNLTTLARGKYLRINMTSTGRLYLNEIEVFGTNDSICTHPSGRDPARPTTSVTPASPTTSVTPASPTTSVTPASPTTSVTLASPTTSVTPASPTTSVGSSTYSASPISITTFTLSASATPALSARPTTTSVHSSNFTTTPMSSHPSTSDYSTTSGPSSTPSQSSTNHSGTSFTIFTPASTSPTPALSARPTTTSVHSSSFTTTPMFSQPSTTTTGGSSLTRPPIPTSFPRDPPTHNAVSTDLGHSTGITSAVFFAGLLAGAALAGPAGALSVVCYHWKKKQAKNSGKDNDDTMSDYKEPAYDCPLQLEENPAYEAMQK